MKGVVEEVVKILAENDLYIKQEKCKQKVRKVGFLGVVIRIENQDKRGESKSTTTTSESCCMCQEWDCESSEACFICCSQVEVRRNPSYGDMK